MYRMPGLTMYEVNTSIIPDSLSTGLETTPLAGSPILRVSWIRWNSGFRGSDLAIGDRIVAVNGSLLSWPSDSEERRRLLPQLPGQYAESQTWIASGAKDGDAILLRVRRRNSPGHGWKEVDIQGSLRADRTNDDADLGRLLGPGGPPEREYDGFASPWQIWYENAAGQWRGILDAEPWTPQAITDPAIAQHDQDQERLSFLLKKYPGPFANSAKTDFDRVTHVLKGRIFPIAPGDLTYREIGEERRRRITEAASAARALFRASHAAAMIPAFPSIDPIRGDRAAIAGKLVELPAATNQNWIAQGERTWFTFGQDDQWYFAEGEGDSVQQMLLAQNRYQQIVSPDIRAEFAIIGRILPDPALVVINETGCFGLKVEVVAASIGDALFVDATTGARPVLFAGERELEVAKATPPPDDAPPEIVLTSFFSALKMGDQKLWASLFVDWTVQLFDDQLPAVEPGVIHSLEAPWTDARREILGRAADVRVSWVDDPVLLVSGEEFSGAPRIEQVLIDVDHLRVRDGTLQAFMAAGYTRFWTLQRINDSPWRISSIEGI